jgi:hypothetical protein
MIFNVFHYYGSFILKFWLGFCIGGHVILSKANLRVLEIWSINLNDFSVFMEKLSQCRLLGARSPHFNPLRISLGQPSCIHWHSTSSLQQVLAQTDLYNPRYRNFSADNLKQVKWIRVVFTSLVARGCCRWVSTTTYSIFVKFSL